MMIYKKEIDNRLNFHLETYIREEIAIQRGQYTSCSLILRKAYNSVKRGKLDYDLSGFFSVSPGSEA
jgi:hypothetical protein